MAPPAAWGGCSSVLGVRGGASGHRSQATASVERRLWARTPRAGLWTQWAAGAGFPRGHSQRPREALV